jgi:hypothetical protein
MKSFYAGLLLILFGDSVSATHILNGYISARALSNDARRQQITVTLVLDEDIGRAAASDMNEITLCPGDGNSVRVLRLSRTALGDAKLSLNVFQTEYAYGTIGVYTVNIALQSRSQNMLNIPNSGLINFGLRTTILIEARNQTPTLQVRSDGFQSAVNRPFSFSVAGSDSDGDSLAYLLAVPLTASEPSICRPVIPLPNYRFPNAVQQRGTIKLNARTGEMLWNAPTAAGAYVVALVVEEWRNQQLISQTGFEQVLIVRDSTGTPAVLPAYEPVVEPAYKQTSVTLTPPKAVITSLTMEEDKADLELITFPNPAEQTLTARIFSRTPGPVTCQFMDQNGRLIEKRNCQIINQVGEQSFDLHHLPSGLYWLRLQAGERQTLQKIVRQ